MKMTLSLLENSLTEIKAKYFELGGKDELFIDFTRVLKEAIEFDLAEDVDEPADFANQWFKPRFAGVKEKFDIREVVGKRESDAGKTYSFLDKKWK